jgi:hypothetical protein
MDLNQHSDWLSAMPTHVPCQERCSCTSTLGTAASIATRSGTVVCTILTSHVRRCMTSSIRLNIATTALPWMILAVDPGECLSEQGLPSTNARGRGNRAAAVTERQQHPGCDVCTTVAYTNHNHALHQFCSLRLLRP